MDIVANIHQGYDKNGGYDVVRNGGRLDIRRSRDAQERLVRGAEKRRNHSRKGNERGY